MTGPTHLDLRASAATGRPPFTRLVALSVRLAAEAGRSELLVMVAMQIASVVLVTVGALLTRDLLAGVVDAEQTNGDAGELIPEVLGLAAVTTLLAVAGAVQMHRQRLLVELCSHHGEAKVLAVAGSVELAAFDEPGFHDAVTRAMMAVRLLPSVIGNLSALMRGLAVSLGALVALVAVNPAFAPAMLLVVIPTWFAARHRGRAFHRFATTLTPRDRERRYLAETLAARDAAKEVRAYGLFPFLNARHDQLWVERIGAMRRVADRQLRYSVLAGVAASLIIAATLGVLIALTLSGDVSLAGAGTTAGLVVLIGQRLTLAATSTGGLAEAALFMGDYQALVDREPARDDGAAVHVPGPVRVAAEDLTFAYPGASRAAVRDVTLEIAPGEIVALVGENGSGKTTLAKLLAALYVPDDGRVTWNGTDTAKADRTALRRDVGVIFQDFQRYTLTARENVALGRHENAADEEGVRRAARIAGAHEDLARLPEEYDTMLGPAFIGGTDLSLGQWQRVALARALFRDAPFVILDEPTAALDAQAEHDLFAGIRKLLAGRSVLLISHRFSSVREADRIHLMRDGAIVETGTHEELMSKGGRYAELFELQASPYRSG